MESLTLEPMVPPTVWAHQVQVKMVSPTAMELTSQNRQWVHPLDSQVDQPVESTRPWAMAPME